MNLNGMNISTERLILKGITPSDVKSMFKYRSNPQIYEFQYLKPQTVQDVENYIYAKTCKVPNIPNTWYPLGIFIKESDELVGDMGIHFIGPDSLQVEIGYTLSLEYQGKGYATEAVIGVIDHLFNNFNKHRILASVDPRNTRSIALLERIGMRKEAHFKESVWFNEEWTDDIVYAILEEEWNIEKY
ncbi:GNAT family N-acetyltransferase [Clostridium sporogenes]|uniref:N-acetyltransferase n=1 Tax=Clostridium sporogenes TaxID=1509 RepID=A0AAE6I3P6_CLOSG|nr:GNAT family protein [Clostridium sporogenes]NFP91312.1 GNAT family N-acetyltransferase [Clostridium sporogenes]QDY31640.1 N-acetyltransferase [Clostridium sporogenes]